MEACSCSYSALIVSLQFISFHQSTACFMGTSRVLSTVPVPPSATSPPSDTPQMLISFRSLIPCFSDPTTAGIQSTGNEFPSHIKTSKTSAAVHSFTAGRCLNVFVTGPAQAFRVKLTGTAVLCLWCLLHRAGTMSALYYPWSLLHRQVQISTVHLRFLLMSNVRNHPLLWKFPKSRLITAFLIM